jgi:hypothetical protein
VSDHIAPLRRAQPRRHAYSERNQSASVPRRNAPRAHRHDRRLAQAMPPPSASLASGGGHLTPSRILPVGGSKQITAPLRRPLHPG